MFTIKFINDALLLLGMYFHNVFIKLKDGVTPSQLEALCDNVTLLRHIPGVIFADARRNVATAANEFQYMIVVVLKDGQSLEDYLKDPIHEQFSLGFLDPVRKESQVFDYELT